MPVPDLRLAICRRCRQPERKAAHADQADVLLAAARTRLAADGVQAHCRLSQCLNCCDGGHTVRVEFRGTEVALIGVRTTAELEKVLADIEQIAVRDVPAELERRVYQVWVDGTLVFHRG